MDDDDSSFTRIKLRRRPRKNSHEKELEPVEYLESEEEDDYPEEASCVPLFCLFSWVLRMAETSTGVKRPFLLLYSGYCISCVGDRLWTFAIVFVLERLGGMRLVCLNQFVDAISAMLLSGYLGNWLDRHDRRHGTLTVLAVNNISIAISALMLFICLNFNGPYFLYAFCIGFSILFCAISKCASEGEKLSFTKDWIVVLAKREGAETLSKKNAMLTVIDQTSSVFAPIITSYSLTLLGYRGACAFFVCVNLIFWIERCYRGFTAKSANCMLGSGSMVEMLVDRQNLPLWRRLGTMLHAYFRQSVFPAAFGLSMLYMTVLGFDGLAISFGKSQDLPDDVIGWFRSAGSALGIAGAASYATIERRLGVRHTGLIGLILQQLFLYLCILSIILPGSPFNPQAYLSETTWSSWRSRFLGTFSEAPVHSGQNLTHSSVSSIDWSSLTIRGQPLTSIFVFFMGLTLARFGLWMADLSITQIMQESVPERERGTVFGVQTAFCQLFSVSKDVIVLVFPDPRTFGWLIIMSVTFVAGGFLNYIYYIIKTRQLVLSTSKTHHSSAIKLSTQKTSQQELRPLTSKDQKTDFDTPN